MSFEEQNKTRDQYKEIELKYKRYDVLARVIGAFAVIASAIAAFVALRGYTGFSTAIVQARLDNLPLFRMGHHAV